MLDSHSWGSPRDPPISIFLGKYRSISYQRRTDAHGGLDTDAMSQWSSKTQTLSSDIDNFGPKKFQRNSFSGHFSFGLNILTWHRNFFNWRIVAYDLRLSLWHLCKFNWLLRRVFGTFDSARISWFTLFSTAYSQTRGDSLIFSDFLPRRSYSFGILV